MSRLRAARVKLERAIAANGGGGPGPMVQTGRPRLYYLNGRFYDWDTGVEKPGPVHRELVGITDGQGRQATIWTWIEDGERAWDARRTTANPGKRKGGGMEDRPLAAPGLKSFRYRGRYGWIMIGATDKKDALREAARSTGQIVAENLQVWDGHQYVSAEGAG